MLSVMKMFYDVLIDAKVVLRPPVLALVLSFAECGFISLFVLIFFFAVFYVDWMILDLILLGRNNTDIMNE